MKTGFYNINSLDTNTLQKFFKDAVMLSYDVHIDKIDTSISLSRQRTSDFNIKDMIDDAKSVYHNFCIDRSIQYKNELKGDVGYTLLNGSYFLYMYRTLDNLKILTDKYKLIME